MHDLDADIFTVAQNAVTPEIIDRTCGRCVNSSNKWGKNWRTLE
jgi:hypothetical protein